MRHFITYHNPELRGPYQPDSRFGIVTDKPVDSLRGDRVWLVTSGGTPLRYYLCETFVVDVVDRCRSGPYRNRATGSSGLSFVHPVRIDSAPWFPMLRRVTGNFAFGLQRIKNPAIIAGLLRVASSSERSGGRWRHSRASAGFGGPVENRLVERASVKAVGADYRSREWTVQSQEALQLGYDLLCRQAGVEHHVEVMVKPRTAAVKPGAAGDGAKTGRRPERRSLGRIGKRH